MEVLTVSAFSLLSWRRASSPSISILSQGVAVADTEEIPRLRERKYMSFDEFCKLFEEDEAG